MNLNEFESMYFSYMIPRDASNLPKPHGISCGILHNFRRWECWKIFDNAAFSPDDSVLDTGSLHTYFGIFIAKFVREITLTDNFYWAQRQYVQAQGLFSPNEWIRFVESIASNLRATEADLQQLSFGDSTFDKVVCVSTIEHVVDDKKAISEMARVTKPGGLILITTEQDHTSKDYSESDGSYYRLYTNQQFVDLIQHPLLETVKVEEENPGWRGNVFACLRKKTT
jgi:SAM-dependent methyltransferase